MKQQSGSKVIAIPRGAFPTDRHFTGRPVVWRPVVTDEGTQTDTQSVPVERAA